MPEREGRLLRIVERLMVMQVVIVLVGALWGVHQDGWWRYIWWFNIWISVMGFHMNWNTRKRILGK